MSHLENAAKFAKEINSATFLPLHSAEFWQEVKRMAKTSDAATLKVELEGISGYPEFEKEGLYLSLKDSIKLCEDTLH